MPQFPAQTRLPAFDHGDSFDTGAGDSFPITLNPPQTIYAVLLPTVGGEVDIVIPIAQ